MLYKVTCSYLRKYIGETGRTLEKRMRKHQKDVSNKKILVKITGLSQHLRDTRHTPDGKEVEILAKENNIRKRQFKGSAAITRENKDSLFKKGGEKKYQ